MTAIRLEGVTRVYGANAVLRQITLDVQDRERLVLLGPSGSGKTTLLRVIAGLDTRATGRVWLHGEDASKLAASKRGIAMVFQDYAVYPHLTVADNLRASISNKCLSANQSQASLDETLEWFRIADLVSRKPGQLSGGQLQRVALAKAIIGRPRILLLDEPFSQLDAALRDEFRELLLRVHAEFSMTMVVVTHDALDALRLGSRVVILDRGELIEAGETLSVYSHPRHKTTACLLSPLGINWLELHEQKLPNGCEIAEPLKAKLISSANAIGFRPEAAHIYRHELGIDSTGLKIAGRCCAIQSIGFAKLAQVRCGHHVIRILLDRNSPSFEENVELAVSADDLLWF